MTKAKNILRKPAGLCDNFDRKPGGDNQVTHYCPGCGHGRIHKLIAEAMEDLDIIDKTILISPVGCSVFAYYYFDCGNIQAAHGRAPAIGSGIARSNPHGIVISYQGDGDLAAIGTSEILHAANRGEKMTVIFVNNGIYGMTGGQMAPTTLEGQKTATTPYGRDIHDQGYPIRMAEIIATLEAPVFVERTIVSDSKGIMKTKRAIQKALKSQKEGYGFSFVEILSACPIGWKLKPTDAIKRLQEEMETYFPVKNFKDVISERDPQPYVECAPKSEMIIKELGLKDNKRLFEPNRSFVENFPTQQLRIAGFGGQGVLMAGTILGFLGMEHDLNATWLPSYGPEMRGGTANCHVILSNKMIGTPVVENPNVLIAMNRPSLDTFEDTVEKNGLIIVNSSIVNRKVKRQDLTSIYIPMTKIAEDLNLRQASNMVAITTYLSYTKIMEIDRFKELVKTNFKKKELIDKNLEVIDKTSEYIKNNF